MLCTKNCQGCYEDKLISLKPIWQNWLGSSNFLLNSFKMSHNTLEQLFRFRSSCPEVFCEKVVLKISQNSQVSNCARFSFSIKLPASVCNLLKKRLWQRCFPATLAQFLRTTFYRTPPGAASVFSQFILFFNSFWKRTCKCFGKIEPNTEATQFSSYRVC